MIKKKIAILLPYKENYSESFAGAASIWVKDYLSSSKLKSITNVYGNLKRNLRPLTSNFINIDISGKVIRKNIKYTEFLYRDHLKKKYSIIEIHNRPESLLFLLKKKINSKLTFIFHNNPKDMRGSTSVNERLFIAENCNQVYFVSKWVMDKFFENLRAALDLQVGVTPPKRTNKNDKQRKQVKKVMIEMSSYAINLTKYILYI